MFNIEMYGWVVKKKKLSNFILHPGPTDPYAENIGLQIPFSTYRPIFQDKFYSSLT